MEMTTLMDTLKLEEKYAVPEGDYIMVAWDMVTTGGNLYDDICQLVAYTPGTELFSQHVMPYHNMSLGTRRRHNLNVISAGRYRILKDVRSNTTLSTKTAYGALNDFIKWLDQVKGSSDGLIMVNHDSRHLISALLLEVLKNYNLEEQFCSIVKGFSNCCNIAESKCDKSIKPSSIRSLSNALLSNEENKGEYENRVEAIYHVIKHIFQNDDKSSDKSNHQLGEDARCFSCTVKGVHKMIDNLKAMQLREESLHPLFNSMRSNRSERQRSFNLQRLLARSNIDYKILSGIYNDGGVEAIIEILKCTLAQEHAREMEELKHVFALHFNPDYKGEWKPAPKLASQRPPRVFRRNFRNKRSNKNSKSPVGTDSTNNKATDAVVDTPTTEKGDTEVPALTLTNELNQTQSVTAVA